MPRLRQKKIIYHLDQLSKYFPEYGQILELLIEQIQQGNEAQIIGMLQMLEDEDW
ncbi:hypothetical protein [Moorena producens]|uniref:hypothetical protein n=1 Tax=Moorena producens TaxID=1155739 RepID=UPI003C70D1D8